MRRSSLQLAIVVVAVALLQGACVAPPTAPPELQTPSAGVITPTVPVPSGSPAPAGTPSPEEESLSFQTVNIEEIGLRFEVPAGWTRVDSEWAWAPPGRGAQQIQELLIGVHWAGLAPAQEPEAVLLPGPSRIIDSAPVEVSWGSGRSFQLEIYEPTPEGEGEQAPISSVETHVLIVAARDQRKVGFDFYGRAEDAQQLSEIESFLWHMLDSSTLTE